MKIEISQTELHTILGALRDRANGVISPAHCGKQNRVIAKALIEKLNAETENER